MSAVNNEELKQGLNLLYQAAATALLSKPQHDQCQAAAQKLMDYLEESGGSDAKPDEPEVLTE
tara:strand:+ start:127 stop:315 length:189 start_codon:yes stop_codon:yes gene_type:complete